MRKLIGLLLLSLSIITLIACSKNNYQSLDGEYYWISSERNKLAFTIKLPFSMEKPITLPLTNKRIRSN